jgi:hypothetical protein
MRFIHLVSPLRRGNQPSVFVKCGSFHDMLRNCKIFENDYTRCSKATRNPKNPYKASLLPRLAVSLLYNSVCGVKVSISESQKLK